jgi:3-deoxy-D-manno-octulosonic-acid transferase
VTAARFLYTLLVLVGLPFIALRLIWRAFRQPAYLRHVGQRFGWYDTARIQGVIWIHAVSVGETRAAQPLVEALLARREGGQVLMTYMTPTGRETGEALFGERVLHAYLPYDYPAAVVRFLEHFRPCLGLIMETEIWFNLLAGCAARRIPMLLVNGRLSEKSAVGYKRIAGLARPALRSLAAVTAQSEADAGRFRLLGAEHVFPCGNLKFDITPNPALVAHGLVWRAALPAMHQVVAVTNTREGEEALILDAFRTVPEERRARVLLVLVPRHPQRFDDVAALVRKSGLRLARRSLNQLASADTQVWLGDSMGEMAAYYAMCDVAFVGGSLLPFGAHNLIEACAQGKPVLIGPHTFNFAEATDLAISREAAVRVADATMAVQKALELLDDAVALRRRSVAASRFAAEHRGATEKTMALMAPLLGGT